MRTIGMKRNLELKVLIVIRNITSKQMGPPLWAGFCSSCYKGVFFATITLSLTLVGSGSGLCKAPWENIFVIVIVCCYCIVIVVFDIVIVLLLLLVLHNLLHCIVHTVYNITHTFFQVTIFPFKHDAYTIHNKFLRRWQEVLPIKNVCGLCVLCDE